MALDNMLNDRLGNSFAASPRFFGGAESYGVKKTEEMESKATGETPIVPMESPAATGRKKTSPTNPGNPITGALGATGDASTTAPTTPDVTAVAPTGTNYTKMALYIGLGAGAGYAIGHFGLKEKSVMGLKGMHLNIALAVLGAGAGYLIYNQTA